MADPKTGTGKKPKGSDRRLYTDENPRDTVKIKFATPADASATVKKVKNIKKLLESISISKGTSQFKLLYEWNHDMKNIECYGWFDGDAGFENKHELIPNGISDFLEEDSSEKLLFGDIFLIKKNNKNKLIDFCVSDLIFVFEFLVC